MHLVQEWMPSPLASLSVQMQPTEAFEVNLEEVEVLRPVGLVVEREQVTRMLDACATNSLYADVPTFDMEAIDLARDLAGSIGVPDKFQRRICLTAVGPPLEPALHFRAVPRLHEMLVEDAAQHPFCLGIDDHIDRDFEPIDYCAGQLSDKLQRRHFRGNYGQHTQAEARDVTTAMDASEMCVLPQKPPLNQGQVSTRANFDGVEVVAFSEGFDPQRRS